MANLQLGSVAARSSPMPGGDHPEELSGAQSARPVASDIDHQVEAQAHARQGAETLRQLAAQNTPHQTTPAPDAEKAKAQHGQQLSARADAVGGAGTENPGPPKNSMAQLLDPNNLENPKEQLRQLREIQNNSKGSEEHSAKEWKALAAKYKCLTKEKGTPWTRDSTYNGLWANGAQQATLAGKSLGREELNQATGIAAESGAPAAMGVAAGGVASKAMTGAAVITKEVIARKSPGRDGAKSAQIIERANGKMISRSHVVEKDGAVLHQHQNHTGKHHGERQFPSEWTGVKHINAPYENIPPTFPAEPVPGGRTF